MKTRNIKTIACALAVAALVGCGSNTNSTANTSTSSGGNTTATATATPAPQQQAASTPTETARQLLDAMRKKDVAAIKAAFTKKTLAIMEVEAKRQNKSLDDVLMGMINSTPMPATFNARNEKINGDRASVETMDDKGQYSPMEFVKEDGAWKVAIGEDR